MYQREVDVAVAAALAASSIIRRHYAHAGTAAVQKGDGSPVTAADTEANAAIVAAVRAAFPEDGVLSEEAADDPSRLTRPRVWIIDPLDGTREFLARNGEFCVHVALAIEGLPTVGVVVRPVTEEVFVAVRGAGAECRRGPHAQRLRVSQADGLEHLRIGITRSKVPEAFEALLRARGLASQVQRIGASVKYLALARGELDAILTVTAGEKEWDTCAPELLVVEAGGMVTDLEGRALRYNQVDISRPRGVVVSNGRCHPALLQLVAPLAEQA